MSGATAVVTQRSAGRGDGWTLTNDSVRSAAESLVAAMDARDSGTASHATSVVRLSVDLLGRLDARAARHPMVSYGFLLHDVGKIAVPDAILMKPGPLTPSEWELMRQHPLWGKQIIDRIPCLAGGIVSTIVRHHHERWDGSGYPDGLARTAIPVECRAFAVVDAFDAMTSNRPYRSAMSVDVAARELRQGSGGQFDPDAVDAFLDVLVAAA